MIVTESAMRLAGTSGECLTQQAAQDWVQLAFECLQGWTLRASLGNLCFTTLPLKTFFSCLKEFLVFLFVPIVSCTVTGYH